MSLAVRQCGNLLSVLSLCSAFVLGAAVPAVAGPVIPVATGQLKISFEGIGDPGGEAGAINLSLIDLGQLQSSPGSVLADGTACPEDGRLKPTGITFVCQNHKDIQRWVKDCYDGKENVRKSGSVIYLDREGTEVLRTYNLYDCFPTFVSKYEGGDCDDADASADLIEVEVTVNMIRVVGKHKGDYLPAHNFRLEIDGCVAGGICPGKIVNDLAGMEISIDAASLAKGKKSDSLKSPASLAVALDPDEDCDGLLDLILQGQGKTSPPSSMKATINTTRSNIRNPRAPGPPPTVLSIAGAQISSAKLPTFQVVSNPTSAGPHTTEHLEIRVQRIEMK